MTELTSAPILSTPAEHTFVEDPTPTSIIEAAQNRGSTTDTEKFHVYEITRTAKHIREQRWNRIALQFPDAMLPDGPWVVKTLSAELARLAREEPLPSTRDLATPRMATVEDEKREAIQKSSSSGLEMEVTLNKPQENTYPDGKQRLYILADTSYSACCVDEIAAEHADADSVVHYGRACLSPTSRIPALYIFTRQELHYEDVISSFEKEFKNKNEDKVVIMADVMFQEHVAPICERLRKSGYKYISATDIIHQPENVIPNRNVLGKETESTEDLKEHHLFHISTPPTALLMTLCSRLASLRIYATPASPYSPVPSEIPDPSMTPRLLQRRYGLVIRLATASVIGILVNTLSVKNYMSTITALKAQIAAAGKKSYTIVVGKLNPAKLANFAEIDGWVVVGCWESGLVEQDGMWKPVITPFELGLALAGDEKRVWTGEWWGGIEGVDTTIPVEEQKEREDEERIEDEAGNYDPGDISDEESAPPEFDLRTGKLISNSRPMRELAMRSKASGAASTGGSGDQGSKGQEGSSATSSALAKRATGEIAMINGIASPGAEFLRTQRTWQGLGTDFDAGENGEVEESTVVEEGRSGIARGYTVGEDGSKT